MLAVIMRSYFSAELSPRGGQMVTSGKGRSATGWGVMVVDTGEFAQSEKEDWIRYPALPNPRTTTNHPTLAVLDLQVEM